MRDSWFCVCPTVDFFEALDHSSVAVIGGEMHQGECTFRLQPAGNLVCFWLAASGLNRYFCTMAPKSIFFGNVRSAYDPVKEDGGQ